ncbi:MAG: hypothetical protein Q4D81_08350 [Eubacteriales bacterium]|nr:hypothetical protein [Eubacteriales bacterium]
MKKKICMRAAALVLSLALLCGCGISAGAQEKAAATAEEKAASGEQEAASAGIQETVPAGEKDITTGATEETAVGTQEETAVGTQGNTSAAEELSAEKIENNGGYFVRVGNKVYFRKYGQQAVENSALFGNFLEYSQSVGMSKIVAYDPESGEVTEVFEDAGYGRLFAGDGGFYCKRAGDGYGDIAYWISLDGTQSVELGQAAPLGISAEAPETLSSAEDASFVTMRDQDPDHAGDLFILHGGEETARAVRGAEESLEFCGMSGEYAIYLNCDTEKNVNYLYSLSGKSGEAVCLGEMPISKEESFYPYLEAEQFLSDEKGVYVVASNYQGTGHFLAYSLAVSAVPGTADSLKLIGSTNLTPPILFLTAPGEAEIVSCPAGTAGLSEGAYGDLVYYDSPHSAVKLIPDYIPEGEWEASDRRFLQTAEVIGDAVYIIVADTARNEAEDIGWRMSYQLKELSWLRVPLPEETGDGGGTGAEPELLTQELF